MSYWNGLIRGAVSWVTAVTVFAPRLGSAEGQESTRAAISVRDSAGTVTTLARDQEDATAVSRTCGENRVGVVDAAGRVTCQSTIPGREERSLSQASTASASLVATYYINIPATTCIPYGATPGPFCLGGGTVRTDGDSSYPCAIASRPTLDTYMCPVILPSGASIQEITAYGSDSDAQGYFEAAVWHTKNTTFTATYFSSFGGTWRSSGVAFSGGTTNFSLFDASQPAHTVLPDARYTIGFGLKSSIYNSVMVHGFRVRYAL